nr:UDP-N-acetylglucosamine 2-epimerase (non-hydrolyzing) [Tepidibacter mesophilus]
MIKIMTIFGTRPEAIKMAPLVKELEKREEIQSIVCVTAQHREMLDQVLELFNISPDYDLDIMKSGQTITGITNRVLSGLEEVLVKEKPDMVLVHGDTTTTFAGSLAAFYNQIEIGHVEAGLRSHNIYSPYPEEMNRSLVGRITNIHFAPTKKNKSNLISENIKEENIVMTGNTVIDALLEVVENNYKFKDENVHKVDFKNKKVILLTSHRRENLGKPMENIFTAVKSLVQENENIEVVFPVHLNPKVREISNKILSGHNRIHLIEPMDYKPFANLINKVDIVMTDSGGIQEEAPALGKPVVVLRSETERPEAVEAGTVKVVGTEIDCIYQTVNKLINNEEEYNKMANAVNPYGDGKACRRIVDSILYKFNKSKIKPTEFNI